MFRIVQEKKGESLIGFKVQELKWSRRHSSEVWMNRGRRFFTVKDANEHMQYLEKLADRNLVPVIEYVPVECSEPSNSDRRTSKY